MLVRDCMTPDPKTIEPDITLGEALGLMRALRIRHLPVVEGGRLVGICTWTDLMGMLPFPGKGRRGANGTGLLHNAEVRDVMTKDPLTVTPDAPVEIAARMLRERKIGSLPVVERDMLVGIVTESDLFDALIHLLGGDIRGVRMSVELPRGLRDLARFAEILGDLTHEKGMVAVATRIDDVSHRGYVRVATASPLALAEHLATAGFEISNLRFETPSKGTRSHSS
jgi:acetoin utilization protein AcuB